MRRDTSAERDLTEAREAHQKALATAAALKEGDRTIELVHHLGPVEGPYPHSRSQDLLLMEILGTEQEALLGAAGGEPCPLL